MITNCQTHPGDSRQAVLSTIAETVSVVSQAEHPVALRAVILTGSFSRQEATIASASGFQHVMGDADFLLVFHEGRALPSSANIADLRRRIESALRDEAVRCSVSLHPVKPGYLKRIRPHVFGYELLRCGQVIRGDSDILALIPPFEANAIPIEDGWRMLGNRMIELLEVFGQLGESCEAEVRREAILHRIVKLYLDMATSFLIFRGAYEPGYRKRAQRLTALGSTSDNSRWPFTDSAGFVDRVRYCTRLKLAWADLWEDSAEELSRCAFEDLRSLWRWELQELTGRHDVTPVGELMRSWIAMQPLWERTRGWAALLRQCGWAPVVKQWPRLARCMLNGSPRYLVYDAASRLFFGHPDAMSGVCTSAAEIDLESVRQILPDVRNVGIPSKTPRSLFRTVTSEIAWNYHQFLETTRA